MSRLVSLFSWPSPNTCENQACRHRLPPLFKWWRITFFNSVRLRDSCHEWENGDVLEPCGAASYMAKESTCSLVQGVLLSKLANLTVSKWQPCEIIHKMMKNENLDIVAEDMDPWLWHILQKKSDTHRPDWFWTGLDFLFTCTRRYNLKLDMIIELQLFQKLHMFFLICFSHSHRNILKQCGILGIAFGNISIQSSNWCRLNWGWLMVTLTKIITQTHTGRAECQETVRSDNTIQASGKVFGFFFRRLVSFSVVSPADQCSTGTIQCC